MDDDIPAGPVSTTTTVRIGAPGVDADTLEEIAHWAAGRHSPVGSALARSVTGRIVVERMPAT